ncbi:MAG: hypothetical protein VYE22_17895 [Myxococcota bacterium]|nr:hypothetical protein [Myxococcota bacterium]
MSPDEERLLEKLRRIEALHANPGSDGEGEAAAKARDRIRERLEELRGKGVIEVRFSMPDHYSRRLLMALMRRYGLEPYRYSGQRYTTVMVSAPKKFLDEVFWPEFKEISEELTRYLDETTNRVIQKALDADTSEAAVRDEPPQLT